MTENLQDLTPGTELSYIHMSLMSGIKDGKFINGMAVDLAVLHPELLPAQIEHALYILDGYCGSAVPEDRLPNKYSYQWIEGTTHLVVWTPSKKTPRRAVEDAVIELNSRNPTTSAPR